MDLQFRPARSSDSGLIADLATAMRPDEPVDPEVERYFMEHSDPSSIERRFIGEVHGEPVAFVVTAHRAWPEGDEVRGSHLDLAITPSATTPPRLGQLIAFGVDSLRAEDAAILECYAREDEGWLRSALLASGLEQDHLSRIWELDLLTNRDRLLATVAQTRRQSRAIGVTCMTLAQCGPDRLDRLHHLNELARRDVPRSLPALPNPKGLFLRWLRMPGITEERYWIAERAGEFVGFSYLRYPPLRGHVWTGFTGSHPEHRGQGIARAVKMETLAQAIELGVPRVRTDNDERNAPMLHINEKLGYHAIPGWVSHLKRLVPPL